MSKPRRCESHPWCVDNGHYHPAFEINAGLGEGVEVVLVGAGEPRQYLSIYANNGTQILVKGAALKALARRILGDGK